MAETKGPLFTISELGEELGITPRTIRYYEEMGLLEPQRYEDVGQRLYGPRERTRLKLILRGKRFGFSLAEIKEMIDLYYVDPTEKEQLRRVVAYGEKRLKEIDELLKDLRVMREEMLEYHRRFTARLQESNPGVDVPGKAEEKDV